MTPRTNPRDRGGRYRHEGHTKCVCGHLADVHSYFHGDDTDRPVALGDCQNANNGDGVACACSKFRRAKDQS